jgi:hypothetical protein
MVLVPYEVFFSTFALIKVVITQIWIPQNVPFYFKYFFKNCLKIKNFKFQKKKYFESQNASLWFTTGQNAKLIDNLGSRWRNYWLQKLEVERKNG